MAAPEEYALSAAPGQPVTLPLAHGPATGYGWELTLPPGVERLADEPGAPVPEGARLGGSAGARIRVRAAPGAHVIDAQLVRPWQRDDPIRTVRIRLTVA